VPYQFHPVSELQKMQYPGDAALDMDFRAVQPVGDLTITEALTDQAKDRAQDSYFFPKARIETSSTPNDSALRWRSHRPWQLAIEPTSV